MKKLVITAVVSVAASVAVPPAGAAVSPTGKSCRFIATNDPQVEGSFTAEIDAGPLYWNGGGSAAGTVTCSIQVNAGTHAEAEACAVSGLELPFVGVAGGTCTYMAAEGDNVYLCTEVEVNGRTLYYEASAAVDLSASWSADPRSSCALATTAESGIFGRVTVHAG